jgi:hypothetical protein
MSLPHDGHHPLHCTGDMRCLSPFCIDIAVCWWAVVHNDTVVHVFVVLVSLCSSSRVAALQQQQQQQLQRQQHSTARTAAAAADVIPLAVRVTQCTACARQVTTSQQMHCTRLHDRRTYIRPCTAALPLIQQQRCSQQQLQTCADIPSLTWLVRCADMNAARHTAPSGICICLSSDA